MFASRYTAFIDACALVGVLKRNVLLSLAEAEFFRLAWSHEVLAETERAITRLLAQRGVIEPAKIAHLQIARMMTAFPDACVENYEALNTIVLPDPGDLHVVSAAIKAQASAIVTDNIADFPRKLLAQFDLEIKSSDDFIADTISLDVPRAIFALRTMRLRFKSPVLTGPVLLEKMKAARLKKTIALLQGHIDLL